MATSTITLYRDSLITPEKNWIVEDIATYLATLTYLAPVPDFQYIKHSLNLSIKLNRSQVFLDTTSILDYDYISIKNSNEIRTYYYFITNKLWRSESTIELILVMDVLNTFQWNTDYVVNKRTLVMREHKDRIVNNEIDDDVWERNIDLRSEGINPPLYKTREAKIFQNDVQTNWILYYKNKNAYNSSDPDAFSVNNPVECYLATDNGLPLAYATASASVDDTLLGHGEGYYVINESITFGGNTYPKQLYMIYVDNAGDLMIYKIEEREIFVPLDDYETYWYVAGAITPSPISQFDILNPSPTLVFYYKATSFNGSAPYSGTRYEVALTGTQGTFYSDISSIDRTLSENIKIIELPYSPTSVKYNNTLQAYVIGSEWDYDVSMKMYKLASLNTKFQSSIVYNNSQFWDNLVINFVKSSATGNDLRDDTFESKIFHSDYYQPKFVYDSFFLVFNFEKIDFDEWWDKTQALGSTRLFIDFFASTNIVSKFLFKFPQYILKNSTEDYDNIVAVSRNNEQVLYSSQYLNYLRTGYNYDVKNKQVNKQYGEIGLGLSVAGTIMGTIVGAATDNPLLMASSIVGGGISIANQSINYSKSVAQSERNIQQKLDTARIQAVSVQNADDVDLLNAYSDNKAKICWYEPSPTMKQALLDMFYYSGYATQEHKIPTINSRYWFNYLQCELYIDTTSNLPKDIEDQIKMKFKDGCTFFHHHTTWDLSQVKENYESWILA